MDNVLQNKIDNFINKVVETEEFKKIEYLIFSIRKQYLSYMNTFRLNEFKIPGYLVPLTNKVMELFDESHINIVDMRKKCLSPAKKYKLYKSSINKSIHFVQRSLSSSTRG